MADPNVVFPLRKNILIDSSGTQKLEDESYEFAELNEDVFADIGNYDWSESDWDPSSDEAIEENSPVSQAEQTEDEEWIQYLKDTGIYDDLMADEVFDMYKTSMSEYVNNVSSNAAAWSYIENYLESLAEQELNNILAQTGLGAIYQKGQSIFDSLENIKNIFGADFSGGDGFANINSVLDAAENILQNVDQMIDQLGGIISALSNIPEQIGGLIENFAAKFSSLLNFDLSNLLSNLPESILGSLMNLQITQSLFALFRNVQMILKNLQAQFAALKNPKSIKGMIGVIKQLKSMLSMLQSLKAQAEQQAQQMKQFAQQMKNGGLQQLAGSILSSLSGGVSFIEHPSQYQAKYPLNHGYTTPGNHTIEVDSTKGKERFKWTHPANSTSDTSATTPSSGGSDAGGEVEKTEEQKKKRTSFEVHPDGSITVATKGDEAKFQLTSKKIMEIDADILKITARTRLEIQAPDIIKDVSGTQMSPGQQETTNGPNTISGQSVAINGTSAVTVTSPSVVELAAGKLGGATSGSISIDAATGTIKILAGPGPLGTAAIILDPNAGISMITQNSLKVVANLGIQSMSNTNRLSITSGNDKSLAGITRVNSGLIMLNS